MTKFEIAPGTYKYYEELVGINFSKKLFCFILFFQSERGVVSTVLLRRHQVT